MEDTTRRAIQLLADSHRTLAENLEKLLENEQPRSAEHSPSTQELVLGGPNRTPWDPETDSPLVSPKVHGSREEMDWCSLTYLGGIFSINIRYGRGATRDEVRDYAIKAGYKDGRAVTAWSKGNGGTQNDADMQRWITPNGAKWVLELAQKLGLSLPADLTEQWNAPDFREGSTR